MIKKSVWSGYFLEAGPEEMVGLFAKAGYKYCELSFEHAEALIARDSDVRKTGMAFRRFAYEHGISFTQGHLPLTFKICQCEEDLKAMEQYLDLFDAIGIRYCVIHCDKFLGVEGMTLEKIREENIRALQKLGAHIQNTELVICLENLNVFPITAEELLAMLEKLDEKHFAICLDTGHLHMNGGNLAEFIRKAGSKIKALHIADNEGATDQHMMPCGRGSIDFVEVFRELKKAGYSGLYNLEIPGETEAPFEIKMLKLDYISKMMDLLDHLSNEIPNEE